MAVIWWWLKWSLVILVGPIIPTEKCSQAGDVYPSMTEIGGKSRMSLTLSNPQKSRANKPWPPTSTMAPKADSDQVRTETSLKNKQTNKKSSFKAKIVRRKLVRSSCYWGRGKSKKKKASPRRLAGQQPAKRDHIRKQSSPQLHQGELRQHHECGRPVGPSVTGSVQYKLKASIDNWNHIAWILLKSQG